MFNLMKLFRKPAPELPVLYNIDNWGDVFPLGDRSVSYRHLRGLKVGGLEDHICILHKVLQDVNTLKGMTAYLETSQGLFCRTIEDIGSPEQTGNHFEAKLEWSPILVGKEVTVRHAYVVHCNTIMKFFDFPKHLVEGNTLNLTFTFTGGV